MPLLLQALWLLFCICGFLYIFFFIVPRQSPEAMTFNTGSAARGRGQGALLAVSLYSYFLLRVRAHRYEPLANQNNFASPNHRLLLNARGLRAYCWRYYKFRLSANIVFFSPLTRKSKVRDSHWELWGRLTCLWVSAVKYFAAAHSERLLVQ